VRTVGSAYPFASSASGLEPVLLVDIITVPPPGEIVVTTSPGLLTGPTSDFGQWITTGGGAPNPTLITEGPSIVLQNDLWKQLGMPTTLAYVRGGGDKWRSPTGRPLTDFAVSIPFP
jgi:hypothetical protein